METNLQENKHQENILELLESNDKEIEQKTKVIKCCKEPKEKNKKVWTVEYKGETCSFHQSPRIDKEGDLKYHWFNHCGIKFVHSDTNQDCFLEISAPDINFNDYPLLKGKEDESIIVLSQIRTYHESIWDRGKHIDCKELFGIPHANFRALISKNATVVKLLEKSGLIDIEPTFRFPTKSSSNFKFRTSKSMGYRLSKIIRTKTSKKYIIKKPYICKRIAKFFFKDKPIKFKDDKKSNQLISITDYSKSGSETIKTDSSNYMIANNKESLYCDTNQLDCPSNVLKSFHSTLPIKDVEYKISDNNKDIYLKHHQRLELSLYEIEISDFDKAIKYVKNQCNKKIKEIQKNKDELTDGENELQEKEIEELRNSRCMTINKMQKIINKDFNFTRDKNGRIHTTISNLLSDAKKYLRINKERLYQIDVKNSQPCCMAILFENIINKKAQSVYYNDINILNDLTDKRLTTLQKKNLIKKLINVFKYLSLRNQEDLIDYIEKNEINIIKINKLINILNNKRKKYIINREPEIDYWFSNKYNNKSFLYKPEFFEEIKTFKKTCERGKIYELFTDIDFDRKEVKTAFYEIMYGPVRAKKNIKEEMDKQNPEKKYLLAHKFSNIFPNLDRLVKLIKSGSEQDTYKRFANMLQQIESEIIIDTVVKNIFDKIEDKDFNILTIHDSIHCTKDYVALIKEEFKQVYKEYGFKVPLKTTKL